MAAANVGTSLSMALSVLDLCPLTEWLTCKQALVKISIVSAILRDIVTTLTKDKCAWDFGSAIAPENCNGYGNADGYTGWNSVSRIFVEEVPKAQA